MWIELHDTARDHPKILKMSRDIGGVSQVVTLGHVTSLWLWTLRMAPDGDLSSFDAEDIEIGAMWDGEPGAFVKAAVKNKLLDIVDGAYHIHDWQDYAQHLKSAQRKREERKRKASCVGINVTGRHVTSRDTHTKSQDVTHMSQDVTPCPSDRPDQTRPDRPDRPDDDDQTRHVTSVTDLSSLSIFSNPSDLETYLCSPPYLYKAPDDEARKAMARLCPLSREEADALTLRANNYLKGNGNPWAYWLSCAESERAKKSRVKKSAIELAADAHFGGDT